MIEYRIKCSIFAALKDKTYGECSGCFLYTLTDGVKVLRCEDVKMFIDAT